MDRNRRSLRLTRPYLRPPPQWHTRQHDHLRTLPRHRDIHRLFLQRLLLLRRTSIRRQSRAKNGRLAIFAGGDKSVVKRLSPLFALLGKVNYMGATGKGQFAKLANQISIASRFFIIINYVLFFFFFFFF